MAAHDGRGHHGGDADPDVPALWMVVATLEQRLDALSDDVQLILAAVGGGGRHPNQRLQPRVGRHPP